MIIVWYYRQLKFCNMRIRKLLRDITFVLRDYDASTVIIVQVTKCRDYYAAVALPISHNAGENQEHAQYWDDMSKSNGHGW